ncbi:hypothetical protein [Mycolicibacterium wolinskyi]|uniref:hypothetical protein n=1 Tax=Mycolicibacterium wolinskyi TaxID=59750 RepID=UPI003BA8D101
MTVPTPGSCRHCTVPLNDPARASQPETDGVCTFCADYTPPETTAQRLDILVNKVDLLRHDLNKELQGLPTTAPLMAVVDLVTALGHLREAAVLLDKATDQLEADPPETAGCQTCRDTQKVRVSTGKWSYTAPCPACMPREFDAAEVDGDHIIVGPETEQQVIR